MLKSYSAEPRHALSFDVEEHFQVSAFWSPLRRRCWDQLESRVENNTRRLVDILDGARTKATFFVLGWVAERHPALIKYLVDKGHEIASHGYGHELVSGQSPQQFREDVRKAKQIIEDLSGKPVLGYRAPSFSINQSTDWALEILAEEGHVYDSSVYPRFRSTDRMLGVMRSAYQISTPSGDLWEVPLSTYKACGVNIPVAGGGYFRLFPYPLLRIFLKRLDTDGMQLVMYLHPWEIDPHQPRMKGPLVSRIRHYMNLKETEHRIISLLGELQFGAIIHVIEPLRRCCGDAVAKSGIAQTKEVSAKASTGTWGNDEEMGMLSV